MDDLSDFLAGLHGQLERCAAAAAADHEMSAATRRSSAWRVAAYGMVCLVAAAVAFGIVFWPENRGSSHTADSGTKAAPAPSRSRAGAGRIVAGAPPQTVGDELTGMVRGLDGELWAWGYRHRLNARGTSLLERWDGRSWQVFPTTAREILGVAALSSDDVWVAENTRHAGRLAHWDGTAWKTFPAFPFVATSEISNALLALSPTDIWAVGSADAQLRTLHWDGRRWHSVPVPAVGSGVSDVSLRLVRGVSPDAVWAIGSYLLFWDGRRWTRQPLPIRQLSTGAKDTIAIDDLAVTSDGQLWCSGRRWFGPDNRGGLFVPVVLRLREGEWQVMASSATPSLPADWTKFMPRSIAATSSRDVWVAGQNDTTSSMWHWDGSAWSVVDFGKDIVPGFKSGPEATTLFSVRGVLAVARNDVWVLCQGGTVSDRLQQLEPFFLHFDGVAWQRVPAAPDAGAQP